MSSLGIVPTQRTQLHLSGNPDADRLLSKDPTALLIGMVLDQQVPLEWAFAAPLELSRRLGKALDVRALAAMPEEELVAAFVAKPVLHRYPAAMARRVHEMCRLIVDEYDGNAARLWASAKSGTELLRRVKALPGFGEQKAKIFVALLGKQLGVTPEGWVDSSKPFSEPGSHRSIADIDSAEALIAVREHKRAMKAAAKAAAGKAVTGARARAGAASRVGGAKKAGAKKAGAKKVGAKKVGAKKTPPRKAAAGKAGPAPRKAATKKTAARKAVGASAPRKAAAGTSR